MKKANIENTNIIYWWEVAEEFKELYPKTLPVTVQEGIAKHLRGGKWEGEIVYYLDPQEDIALLGWWKIEQPKPVKEITMKKQIAIIWTAEDVKAVNPNLTDEQASQVLETLENKHDATIGINWDVIQATIENMGFDK